MKRGVVILGVFVADTAYRAGRMPRMGETILGESFALGPGGKGSNQAVAVGRLGEPVTFITRLGDDAFGEMAVRTWQEAGVTRVPESYTGAAFIFVDARSGDNAIIISPGAAATIVAACASRSAGAIVAAAPGLMMMALSPLPASTKMKAAPV